MSSDRNILGIYEKWLLITQAKYGKYWKMQKNKGISGKFGNGSCVPGFFGHATKFNSLTDSFLTGQIYRSFDNTLRSVFPGNDDLLKFV